MDLKRLPLHPSHTKFQRNTFHNIGEIQVEISNHYQLLTWKEIISDEMSKIIPTMGEEIMCCWRLQPPWEVGATVSRGLDLKTHRGESQQIDGWVGFGS